MKHLRNLNLFTRRNTIFFSNNHPRSNKSSAKLKQATETNDQISNKFLKETQLIEIPSKSNKITAALYNENYNLLLNNSKSTSNYDDDLNLKKYPIPSPITSHSKIRENNQTLAENFNFSMSINHLHFKKTATKTKQTHESTDKISTQTPKETQKKILPSSSDRIFN